MQEMKLESTKEDDFSTDVSRHFLIYHLIPFLFILFLFCRLAGVGLWDSQGADIQDAYLNKFINYTSLFLTGIFFFVFRKTLLKKINIKLPLKIFLFLCFITVFINPETARSGFLAIFFYLVISLTVPMLLDIWGKPIFLRRMAQVSAIFIIVNLFYSAAADSAWMVDRHSDLLRGLLKHKNDFGYAAVLSLFYCYFGIRSPLVSTILCFLSAVCIGLSWSGQAVVLSFLGLSIILFSKISFIMGKKLRFTFVLCLLCLFNYIGTSDFSDSILEFLGKNADLTGRDRIWLGVWDEIVNSPAGTGFGGFFSDYDKMERLRYYGVYWDFSTAHSSFLEAFLVLGWAGGAFFVFMTVYYVLSLLFKFILNPTENALPLMMILLCAVGGLTASEKFFLPNLGWFTFVFAIYIIDFGGENCHPGRI
jgi:hypothetical protein